VLGLASLIALVPITASFVTLLTHSATLGSLLALAATVRTLLALAVVVLCLLAIRATLVLAALTLTALILATLILSALVLVRHRTPSLIHVDSTKLEHAASAGCQMRGVTEVEFTDVQAQLGVCGPGKVGSECCAPATIGDS